MKLRPLPAGAERSRQILEHLPDEASERAYAAESVQQMILETIAEAMEISGVSRADLAAKLGKSRSAITAFLSGRNLTLRTVGELLWACGFELTDTELDGFGVSHIEAMAGAVGPSLLAEGHLTMEAGQSPSTTARITAKPDEMARPVESSQRAALAEAA